MSIQIGDVLELAIRNQPFDKTIAYKKAPPQPSENWERDALAAILWLQVHGKLDAGVPQNFDTLDEIAAWYPKQDFCGSEDFSRIYGGRNVASGVAAREAFKLLKHEAGYQFFVDWCRAMGGYIALGCGWAHGSNIDLSKLVLGVGKPQLIVSPFGAAPNPDVRGAACFALPGDRSFAHDGLGWITGSGLCTLPHLVLNRDVAKFLSCRTTHPAFAALAERKADIHLLTPEESAIALRASQNDIEAIKTIWNQWLTKAPLPRDKFMVVRRESGVEAVRLEGPEAPTAQMDYVSWEATTKTQRFMAVNDGYRGSNIRSSVCSLSGDTWTASTDNPAEGEPRQISCKALQGPILFQGVFGGGELKIVVPEGSGGVIQPPAPPPTAPGTCADFIRGILGKIGYWDQAIPGSGSGFLATSEPNVVAWVKGMPYPWAIELMELRQDGSVHLLSEAEMVVEGPAVRKYRSFWETGDKIGVQWAPSKTVNFAMVRHGWDAPGETEAGPFTTRTVVELGGGRLTRTDYMAEGTPDAYHETYIFGQYGPMSWALYATPTGVKKNGHLTTYFTDFKGVIPLYGVLTDGSARWVWSAGGSGTLPSAEVLQERRPTAGVLPKTSVIVEPPKKKASWIERMGI